MMPGPHFAERHTNIPIAMKEWDHWCCWQYIQRNGKKTKQPFDPKTGLPARTNNSATWGSYDQAIAASVKFDGIGLVLTNSHFAAFDIDNCRNPETGNIDPETLRFAEYVNSYTEITPSGTGLRIIGIGNGQEIHRSQRLNETVKIETYRRATRFITVTGDQFPGSPSTLFDIDCAVDATVNYLDSIRAKNGIQRIERATTDAYTTPIQDFSAFKETLLSQEILERIKDYTGDKSERLHGIVGQLKQLKWNISEIDSLFSRYPNGVAERYIRERRLRGEIERCFNKLNLDNSAPQPNSQLQSAASIIRVNPFIWIDPKTIPKRQWLYARHYLRRNISATIAPGGLGKSSLAIAEALAMATGRNLIGHRPASAMTVWLWNGEEPDEELQRRITAAMLHFSIDPSEVEGRFFVNSGRNTPIVIAESTKSGTAIHRPVVDAAKHQIIENKIDVMIVDPFISSHRVTENDNNAIDLVVKQGWTPIVEETNCAIDLVHHSRKTGGRETSVEDSRGASALVYAARSARVLNSMTKDEAERAGIDDNHRRYFRIDNDKQNYAPPSDKAWWHKLESITLPNGPTPELGDDVGVVTEWRWPNLSVEIPAERLVAIHNAIGKRRWRRDQRAKDWVGKPVAQVLEFDIDNRNHKAQLNSLIKKWIDLGALVLTLGLDDGRHEREFVELGDWSKAQPT